MGRVLPNNEAQRERMERYKVLLVEDDTIVARDFGRRLEKLGCEGRRGRT